GHRRRLADGALGVRSCVRKAVRCGLAGGQGVEGAGGVVGVRAVGVHRQQGAGGQGDRCPRVAGLAGDGAGGQAVAGVRGGVVGQDIAADRAVLVGAVGVVLGGCLVVALRDCDGGRGGVAVGSGVGGRVSEGVRGGLAGGQGVEGAGGVVAVAAVG